MGRLFGSSWFSPFTDFFSFSMINIYCAVGSPVTEGLKLAEVVNSEVQK
jgi:hypothetical protein